VGPDTVSQTNERIHSLTSESRKSFIYYKEVIRVEEKFMNLAPIGLSVYAREHHVKQTVQALLKNKMASESILYIFSDAPQSGDELKVKKVRKFLKQIEGFKDIIIIERTENSRVKNGRDGIKMMLEKHGRMIFLEEDIVTAPKFLEFMNQALNFYQNDHRIISITGYSPPFKIPPNYKKDIYLSPRFSAWGYGIWKNRYDRIKMNIEGYNEFLKDKAAVKKFRMGGEDLLYLLKLEAESQIDALDVKIMFQQFQNNLYTVSPTISLVQNIGHDGTGVHCGKTKKFNTTLDTSGKKLEMEKKIQSNPDIIKLLYKFRSGGLKGKLDRLLRRAYLLPAVKFLFDRLTRS
jgi:hypothetical protein